MVNMDIPMNDLGEEPATDQTRLLDQPETLPEPATPAHSEASSSGSEPGVQRELDSGPGEHTLMMCLCES